MLLLSYDICISSSFYNFHLCVSSMLNIFSYRSFYIQLKWKTSCFGYMVYVGLGSDPRTNHILYADICRPLKRRTIHHILISTASDCVGEWQFATGTLFDIFKHCNNITELLISRNIILNVEILYFVQMLNLN